MSDVSRAPGGEGKPLVEVAREALLVTGRIVQENGGARYVRSMEDRDDREGLQLTDEFLRLVNHFVLRSTRRRTSSEKLSATVT